MFVHKKYDVAAYNGREKRRKLDPATKARSLFGEIVARMDANAF